MLKTVENLEEYFVDDYGNKELAFKVFKLKLVHLTNIIDEELFSKIFGYTLEALASKLINTIDKEEYETIVESIKENEEKLDGVDETSTFKNYVIRPNDKRNNLIDVINLILEFNEKIQLDDD